MNHSAFKVKVGDRILDYRLGGQVDLRKAEKFFGKKYRVEKVWSAGRYVLGFLEKGNKKLFLKLATTEGISAVTKVERDWNFKFNKLVPRSKANFWVPENFESGVYEDRLFYLVTDRFEGSLLTTWPTSSEITDEFKDNLDDIIEFSELIQTLKIKSLRRPDVIQTGDFREWFLLKTKAWFADIPSDVVANYHIADLMAVVEKGMDLSMRPRHGDFTPWHIFKLKSGQLALIDGEHAKIDSVENYDIAYFIQRVFSVLKNPDLALRIFDLLIKRGYQVNKLKTVLAARAIGGFLDESLGEKSDYRQALRFKEWALSL